MSTCLNPKPTKYFHLFQVKIFMDSEGIPIQELSALVVSGKNIVNSYHNYAWCPPNKDIWSRKNIHGLNPNFLYHNGFPNETILIQDFRKWLSLFNVDKIYVNGFSKHEQIKLDVSIIDIGLPEWSERIKHDYHNIPNSCKKLNHSEAHNCYVSSGNISKCNTPSQQAKISHGWHCSLMDVYELYLFYLESLSFVKCDKFVDNKCYQ